MAHGILYDSRLKHNDVVTMLTQYPAFKTSKSFRTNFMFVRDIYDEVAKENGIILPKTWVVTTKYVRQEANIKTNRWLMEPLGPVVYVDDTYNPLQYFYSMSANGSVVHTANWVEQARAFFMLDSTTADALSTPMPRPSLMCESWRAKSFYLIKK